MTPTTFATPVNVASSTLRLPYTAGDTTLKLFRSYGTTLAAALVAQGLPAISASHPLRFQMVSSAAYNPDTGQITDLSLTTIFEATGLSSDDLSGLSVVEGTTDQDYANGDIFLVGLTAGQVQSIQAAVNALENVGGSVTSVGLTMPTGFSVAGSPITTTGTLAVTTALSGILKGSAGAITTAAAGTDYLAPSGNGSQLAHLTAANIDSGTAGINISGNAATATSATTATTATTAGNVSGTVAIGNGGTGQVTASAAFNALMPLTTLGDTLYASGANTAARLAGNTTSTQKFYAQTGNGAVSAAPGWVTIATSDLPTIPIAGGGTGQITKAAGFDALQPMTTLGDAVYGGASGTGTRLAGNTTATKNFFVQTGNGAVSAAPAWGTIVVGDLPTVTIAKGGTGQTSQSAGFNALSPLTTVGDTLYGGASGTGTRLGGNTTTANQFYRSTGDGANATAPTWAAIAETDVTNLTTDLALKQAATFATGNYYFVGSGSSVSTSNALGAGTLRVMPMYLPTMTITRIGAEVTSAGDAGRSVADAVTNGTTTLTSATAAFTTTDPGRKITGTNIPANTYIQSRTNSTTITMTQAASGSGSGGTLNISGCVVRLGIYNDSSGVPGSLLIDAGTIDGSSATVQEITISQAITAGVYWFAGVNLGVTASQPTIRTIANISAPVPMSSIPTANQTVATLIGSGTVIFALPTPFVNSGAQNTMYRMFFKM